MLVKFMLFRVLRTGGSIDESFNLIESIPQKKGRKKTQQKVDLRMAWSGEGEKPNMYSPKMDFTCVGFWTNVDTLGIQNHPNTWWGRLGIQIPLQKMFGCTGWHANNPDPKNLIGDLRIFQVTRIHFLRYCSMGEGGMLSSKRMRLVYYTSSQVVHSQYKIAVFTEI